MDLRNNESSEFYVRINDPYFIFWLTNLCVYKICVFGITSRTRFHTLSLKINL